MREFDTGATRDTDDGKPDYEGFLSPSVIKRFGEYMHKHRVQQDGNLRASDNWQKGIPLDAYMKSMWRHFLDVWMLHRGLPVDNRDDPGKPLTMDEALCSVLFNVQGYLHEALSHRGSPPDPKPGSIYEYTLAGPVTTHPVWPDGVKRVL